MKLPQVPALLQKYAGNEAVLYAKVCKMYDLNPKVFHLDPKAWEAYGEHSPIDVTVSTMAGQDTTIASISPSDAVMQVWKKAAANLGIPVWASNLCMGSDILEHDLPLIDAGVAAGARLTLVRKPIEQLETAFKRLRTLPTAQAAQNSAAQAVENGVVFVVQEFATGFGQGTPHVEGAFKNRSAAVEKAIERARTQIEEWLDERCADEDDPSCADKLDVCGSRTSITWCLNNDERNERHWTVQELMIE